MTWNSMCADCHSTAVVKGFELGEFSTTYAEENVGCEACHGPGSHHRDDPTVSLSATTDACMPCHSRRTQLRDGYRPGLEVFDFYDLAQVSPPLYHADGQIDDEVYVWGSFEQSRMSAAGSRASTVTMYTAPVLRRRARRLAPHATRPPAIHDSRRLHRTTISARRTSRARVTRTSPAWTAIWRRRPI